MLLFTVDLTSWHSKQFSREWLWKKNHTQETPLQNSPRPSCLWRLTPHLCSTGRSLKGNIRIVIQSQQLAHRISHLVKLLSIDAVRNPWWNQGFLAVTGVSGTDRAILDPVTDGPLKANFIKSKTSHRRHPFGGCITTGPSRTEPHPPVCPSWDWNCRLLHCFSCGKPTKIPWNQAGNRPCPLFIPQTFWPINTEPPSCL